MERIGHGLAMATQAKDAYGGLSYGATHPAATTSSDYGMSLKHDDKKLKRPSKFYQDDKPTRGAAGGSHDYDMDDTYMTLKNDMSQFKQKKHKQQQQKKSPYKDMPTEGMFAGILGQTGRASKHYDAGVHVRGTYKDDTDSDAGNPYENNPERGNYLAVRAEAEAEAEDADADADTDSDTDTDSDAGNPYENNPERGNYVAVRAEAEAEDADAATDSDMDTDSDAGNPYENNPERGNYVAVRSAYPDKGKDKNAARAHAPYNDDAAHTQIIRVNCKGKTSKKDDDDDADIVATIVGLIALVLMIVGICCLVSPKSKRSAKQTSAASTPSGTGAAGGRPSMPRPYDTELFR